MKLRIASDLHLETLPPKYQIQYLQTYLPYLDTDNDSILILAGDLFNFNNENSYLNLLDYINNRFKNVICLAGNHEYYGSNYIGAKNNFLNSYLRNSKNIYLDDQYQVINGVAFLGSTLWTNFNNNDLDTRYIVNNYLNDYNYIKFGNSNITPEIIYQINQESIKFLSSTMNYFRNNLSLNKIEKIVVATHHCPSLRSVHPKYANAGLINYGFSSDLEYIIEDFNPNLWIHGHTHESMDYEIESNSKITKVICNPVGYSRSRPENINYKKDLIIHI